MRTSRLTARPWLFGLLLAGGLPAARGEPFSFSFNFDLDDVAKELGDVSRSVCGTYSTVANYSAVGANPAMRAALQDTAGTGVESAALTRIMDACGRAVGQFTDNAVVNAQCGNLTAVAESEAARNFSRGIVADRVVAGSDTGSGAGTVLVSWGEVVGAVVLVSIGAGLL